MKNRILAFALLLFVCLGLCLTSCGKSKKPAETTPGVTTPGATTPSVTTPPVTTEPPPPEMIDIVANGKTDYALVLPTRSSFADASAVAFSIYEAMSAIKVTMPPTTDSKAEKTYEILVGDTNRSASTAIAERLAAIATSDSFYYLVAEIDGKLVLYANDNVGYEYLLDYFLETYVTASGISVPKGLFDVKSMTWTAYQAHLDELARLEAERIEAEKKAKLDALKATNSAFKTSDFGTITVLPANGASNGYPAPGIYPTANEHPRVLFTQNTVATVRENLTSTENKAAYNRYLEYSDMKTDGILPEVTDPNGDNMNYNILAYIEAKAFRYSMTGEEIYAYEAIIAIKNFMQTLFISTTENRSIHDYCRAYGYTMYIAACVYDWCHPVLTATDKEQIVAGVETYLAPYFEMSFPPKGQGSVTGHGTEAQLLRDWLAFGIAVYDEYPDIYNYVAGRIVSEYVPSSEFYMASGSHWQGSSYGAYRYYMLLFAQTLFSTMTDGQYKLFNDDLSTVIYTFMNYARPDGQGLRIGDVYSEGGASFGFGNYYIDAFYVAVLYDDPVAKAYAKQGLVNFSSFSLSNTALSPVMLLTLNDPTLVPTESYVETLPLVHYNGSPLGSIIARSAWNDKDAVMVYMKIGEAYSANHEHKDAGSFQIFYKGILASDSGYYDSYGTPHDYAYNKQTISSNCLLIYNDNLKSSGKWIYSGGQSIHKPSVNGENSKLSDWLKKSTSAQAKILGSDYATAVGADGKQEYVYSYLAGDLTNAYDAETVEEVSRYMLSVMTGDSDNPMVFIVYDRITAVDASYKKTFLLHVQQEPTIDNTTDSAIVTNTKAGNSGKMHVQSLLTDVVYSVIGGPDQEYMVNGVNYPLTDTSFSATSIQESGWGRIEITPSEKNVTDRLLTVMYVTDATNTAAMIPATEIEGDVFVGTQIFDKVAIFPKDTARISSEFSFTVSGTAEQTYYIAGLLDGTWSISVNGTALDKQTVSDGSMVTFTAASGTVTLTPNFAPITYEMNGGKVADGVTLPTSYAYGEAVAIPTDIIKLGSEFLGWYTEDGTKVDSINVNATGAIKLYAKWNRLYTVVDYQLGAGEIRGEYEYRYTGAELTLPSSVVASGYYFIGWYTSPNFEPETRVTKIEAGLEPENDIKVYARYAKTFANYSASEQTKLNGAGIFELTDNGYRWENDGVSGGTHFTISVASGSDTYSISFDMQAIADKTPHNFVIRLRPSERNKIDTTIITFSGGILYLGGTSGPVLLDLNKTTERHTLTFVFSCDNAGLAAGLAAPAGTPTTSNEYLSTITIDGYVDGVKTASTEISSRGLTFGESYTYRANDGKTFLSTFIGIQFYSSETKTGLGQFMIDNIVCAEGSILE